MDAGPSQVMPNQDLDLPLRLPPNSWADSTWRHPIQASLHESSERLLSKECSANDVQPLPCETLSAGNLRRSPVPSPDTTILPVHQSRDETFTVCNGIKRTRSYSDDEEHVVSSKRPCALDCDDTPTIDQAFNKGDNLLSTAGEDATKCVNNGAGSLDCLPSSVLSTSMQVVASSVKDQAEMPCMDLLPELKEFESVKNNGGSSDIDTADSRITLDVSGTNDALGSESIVASQISECSQKALNSSLFDNYHVAEINEAVCVVIGQSKLKSTLDITARMRLSKEVENVAVASCDQQLLNGKENNEGKTDSDLSRQGCLSDDKQADNLDEFRMSEHAEDKKLKDQNSVQFENKQGVSDSVSIDSHMKLAETCRNASCEPNACDSSVIASGTNCVTDDETKQDCNELYPARDADVNPACDADAVSLLDVSDIESEPDLPNPTKLTNCLRSVLPSGNELSELPIARNCGGSDVTVCGMIALVGSEGVTYNADDAISNLDVSDSDSLSECEPDKTTTKDLATIPGSVKRSERARAIPDDESDDEIFEVRLACDDSLLWRNDAVDSECADVTGDDNTMPDRLIPLLHDMHNPAMAYSDRLEPSLASHQETSPAVDCSDEVESDRPVTQLLMNLGVLLVARRMYKDLAQDLTVHEQRIKRGARAGALKAVSRGLVALVASEHEGLARDGRWFWPKPTLRCSCRFHCESDNVLLHHRQSGDLSSGSGMPLRCCFCPAPSPTRADLLRHADTAHGVTLCADSHALHACQRCQFECVALDELSKHQAVCTRGANNRLNLAPALDDEYVPRRAVVEPHLAEAVRLFGSILCAVSPVVYSLKHPFRQHQTTLYDRDASRAVPRNTARASSGMALKHKPTFLAPHQQMSASSYMPHRAIYPVLNRSVGLHQAPLSDGGVWPVPQPPHVGAMPGVYMPPIGHLHNLAINPYAVQPSGSKVNPMPYLSPGCGPNESLRMLHPRVPTGLKCARVAAVNSRVAPTHRVTMLPRIAPQNFPVAPPPVGWAMPSPEPSALAVDFFNRFPFFCPLCCTLVGPGTTTIAHMHTAHPHVRNLDPNSAFISGLASEQALVSPGSRTKSPAWVPQREFASSSLIDLKKLQCLLCCKVSRDVYALHRHFNRCVVTGGKHRAAWGFWRSRGGSRGSRGGLGASRSYEVNREGCGGLVVSRGASRGGYETSRGSLWAGRGGRGVGRGGHRFSRGNCGSSRGGRGACRGGHCASRGVRGAGMRGRGSRGGRVSRGGREASRNSAGACSVCGLWFETSKRRSTHLRVRHTRECGVVVRRVDENC